MADCDVAEHWKIPIGYNERLTENINFKNIY